MDSVSPLGLVRPRTVTYRVRGDTDGHRQNLTVIGHVYARQREIRILKKRRRKEKKMKGESRVRRGSLPT